MPARKKTPLRKAGTRGRTKPRATRRSRQKETSPETPQRTWARVLEARDRIAPLVPDIDEGDLILILENLLMPPERRWERPLFLREIRPGVYAF